MILPGRVIEYLDNGKFICAYVTELQEKRARLINQNGKEVLLPTTRIVHTSVISINYNGNRDNLLQELKETNERRNTLVSQIVLRDLWELATEEDTATLFTPEFLAELILGKKADDDILAAFLRSIFLDKIYFKYREGQIRVQTRELVDQLLGKREKERQKNELIQKGAEIISAIMFKKPIPTGVDRLKNECLELLKDYYLFGNDAKHSDISRSLLKEAGLHDPHAPYHILVNAGIWGRNENISVLRHEIPVSFTLPARQQAEAILRLPNDDLFSDPGRKDFTHLKPLTIDGPGTLDFDDALTLETHPDGYLIGIHISDVANYVRPGDALFQEAIQRGTSLYFPEGQIPMLPRHLSQGVCSLIQNEVRATVSYMIVLDENAKVLQTRIYPSIIKVARRLTYDDADKIIDSDSELRILNKLRKKLRKNRLEQGALLLPFPDVNIFVDAQGKVHVSLSKTDTPARTLISEMMILANSEAARYLADRIVPGLFRSQPILKTRLVHGEDDDLYLNIKQRKQIPRGELLTSPLPHSGLGVAQYTTVTSPIRRLLDLVMQHQINSVVRRLPPCFTDDMCNDFATVINRTLAATNAVKQQRHRYWLLKYLEERRGHLIDAIVIESGPKRVGVVLSDLLMDVDLSAPHGTTVTPGSTIKLRISKVDALDNVLKLDWV